MHCTVPVRVSQRCHWWWWWLLKEAPVPRSWSTVGLISSGLWGSIPDTQKDVQWGQWWQYSSGLSPCSCIRASSCVSWRKSHFLFLRWNDISVSYCASDLGFSAQTRQWMGQPRKIAGKLSKGTGAQLWGAASMLCLFWNRAIWETQNCPHGPGLKVSHKFVRAPEITEILSATVLHPIGIHWEH